MELFDKAEVDIVELKLSQLLPSTDIELDNKNYRVHIEEKTTATDRCLGVSNTENPDDLSLFKITCETENHPEVDKEKLQEIDLIGNKDTANYLLETALEIKNRVNGKNPLQVPRNAFSKTIAIGSNNYIFELQPPTAGPRNQRKDYEERVTNRILYPRQ